MMFSVRNQRGRIAAAICTLAVGVSALVAASPGAAWAEANPNSTSVTAAGGIGARPFTSSGCSGDSCIYLTNPSPGVLYVKVWAYDANFYGHFQITGADTEANGNTPTQEWYAGGANGSTWAVETISGPGQVCATAWSSSGSNLGKACETNG
jgi:hypothetical protein